MLLYESPAIVSQIKLTKVLYYLLVSRLSLNLLSDGSGGAGVNLQTGMVADLLDQTLSLQIQESLTSARTVDLQAVNEDSGGDELVGGDLLDHLGVGFLLHDGDVVNLLLGLSL